jgi:anti-sigma regulatory factor (Ser/Thr protein kinase)
MNESVELLSMELPCDRNAPSAVRRALGGTTRLGPVLGDGLLVASELVTNAVLHSGCGTDQRIQVSANLDRDTLLISVHDPGASGEEAVPGSPSDSRAGGRGLQIVDQLARRWGAERPDGYHVWAELARPS